MAREEESTRAMSIKKATEIIFWFRTTADLRYLAGLMKRALIIYKKHLSLKVGSNKNKH